MKLSRCSGARFGSCRSTVSIVAPSGSPSLRRSAAVALRSFFLAVCFFIDPTPSGVRLRVPVFLHGASARRRIRRLPPFLLFEDLEHQLGHLACPAAPALKPPDHGDGYLTVAGLVGIE